LITYIHNVFIDQNHKLSKENLEEFGRDISKAVEKSILKAREPKIQSLRMSAIGKPDRQLWYEMNQDKLVGYTEPKEKPEQYLKFLFGDIIETLLVYLIKEAGHTATHGQEDLEIEGVPGHNDPVLDGVVADIKSASNYSFTNKFKNRAMLRPGAENDPFGYVDQISCYHEKLKELYPDEVDEEQVAWLVMNKESAELFLLKADVMELRNGTDRIQHVKKMVTQSEPPKDKCFPDQEDGKSGNRVLHKLCQYCKFKDICWKDANGGNGLRVFQYANGRKYFTNVNKNPDARVQEITRDHEFVVEPDES
jgi:hypothetical protein